MGVTIVTGTVPSCNTGLSTLSSLLIVDVTVKAGVDLCEAPPDKEGVVVMGGVGEGMMGLRSFSWRLRFNDKFLYVGTWHESIASCN